MVEDEMAKEDVEVEDGVVNVDVDVVTDLTMRMMTWQWGAQMGTEQKGTPN